MQLNNTKRIFADTLIRMVKEIPFDKIMVQDIVSACGARRQTFYYHFKDKYDLVTWIYSVDADKIVSDMIDTHPWPDVICAIMRNMEQNHDFYAKVFTIMGQNSLIDYLYQYDLDLYTQVLKKKLGTEQLDDDLLFSIEYHSYACVHLTKRWIALKPHESPEEYTHKLLSKMPDNLRSCLV